MESTEEILSKRQTKSMIVLNIPIMMIGGNAGHNSAVMESTAHFCFAFSFVDFSIPSLNKRSVQMNKLKHITKEIKPPRQDEMPSKRTPLVQVLQIHL